MTDHSSPVNAEPGADEALVSRLRRMSDMNQVGKFYHPLYAEAADEIERLQSRIRAQQMRIPEGCDWPNEPFKFHDEPGEHDPCYVIMPGGAMLPLNHHAGEGVDIARAKFIVAACNAALSHDFPREIVAEAMQDAWNTICSDTGCHPLDIEQQGKKLFFSPGHWTDLIALFLSGHPAFTSPESRHMTADERLEMECATQQLDAEARAALASPDGPPPPDWKQDQAETSRLPRTAIQPPVEGSQS